MKQIFILFFLLFAFQSLQAQDLKELEVRKQQTLNEIKESKALLDKVSGDKRHSLNKLYIIDQGIKSREGLISTIGQEISLLDTYITRAEDSIQATIATIEKGKEEYAKIVYSAYKNNFDEDPLVFLLASENIHQFYQRIKYLKYLKSYRERKIEEISNLKSSLSTRKEELQSLRNKHYIIIQAKEEENRKLAVEKSEKRAYLEKLSRNESTVKAQLAEKERIRSDLDARILRIINEELKAKSTNESLLKLTPEQRLIGDNFIKNKGRLPWPVDRGIIISSYGNIEHPLGIILPNQGIDFRSPEGTKARAIFDGEVTAIAAIKGANYLVIIKHGEYRSVYLNLIELRVKVGDRVLAKEELGTIYASDEIAEFQLQLLKNKERVDPNDWLSR